MLIRIVVILIALVFYYPLRVYCAASCACTSSDTRLVYNGDGEGLDKVYKDLISCPNITDLTLQFQWGGCVGPSEPWHFDFREGDKFPALKRLSLMDYDLSDSQGTRADMWRWQRSWQYWAQSHLAQIVPAWAPKEPAPREPNLDKWLKAMDFSQIEELSLDQQETIFYERMRDKLPSLKQLSVYWDYTGPSVPPERVAFLESVPLLDTLKVQLRAPYGDSLTRTAFPLREIVDRHCPTLQSLSLQQTESNDPNTRRPMLSTSDLDRLATLCPNLTHLSLDIDRNASTGWPNATIAALMRFQNLTSLDIGVELGADLHSSHEMGDYGYNPEGLDGPGPFREPRMSLEVAEALFVDLRSKKEGEQLEAVRFVVGDVPEVGYSGPLYFPSWEEGRERVFTCRADGADGSPAAGGLCACYRCDGDPALEYFEGVVDSYEE